MSDNLKRERTIQGVVRQGFCIGCGTCAIICPQNALTIIECSETGTYVPRLDHYKCNQCGFCLRVCPGIEPDFDKMNLFVFGQKPFFPYVGNYLKCYSGYATDQNIRFTSTSGGLISSLATFALESGIADGVLTTRSNMEKPLRPESFIARTKEEVISAAGSKYCPVSANLALDQITRNEGRFIVIGLPCHIQGLRNVQILNRELEKKVTLVLGLVCNHAPTFHATDFLLKKYEIPSEKIRRLDYRSSGWPGYMKITMNDCTQHFIPFSSLYYWGYIFQKFFWPRRCLVCNDKLCQFADIIFMDAWLPEFSSDKTGVSLVVVRSKKGEEFVSKAAERGIIKLQPIPAEAILRSQQISKITRRVAVTRFFTKYPPKEFSSVSTQRSFPTKSLSNILDALHLLFINRFYRNSSMLWQIVIECHVSLWNFALSIKRKKRRRQKIA